MLCTELTLVCKGPNFLWAEPLRCRSWGCDNCQPMRRSQLIALGLSGNPTSFITLTSSPETADEPVEAARRLVTAWRAIRKEACKRYGYKSLPFLAVFEATEAGRPHLHILARCPWIDQDWLSKLCDVLIAAPIVWIERVKDTKRAAAYVAKYCGKEPERFGTLKRYWTSKDWQPADDGEHPGHRGLTGKWSVVRERYDHFLDIYERLGYLVTREEEGAHLQPPGPPPRAPPSDYLWSHG